MNWTCQQFEERLTDFLEDALSVADRAGFLAHQQECARCRPLAERVNTMLVAMHHVEPIEPPPGLVHRILEQTGPKQERGWFGLAWLTPRLAMSGLTLALFTLMVWPVLGIDVSRLEWSDLKPTNLYHSADRRATLIYARGVKFVNGLRVLHEIQSRLQPAESEVVPVKEDLNKKTENEKKPETKKGQKGQDQNRAYDPGKLAAMVAGLTSGLPGGMIQ